MITTFHLLAGNKERKNIVKHNGSFTDLVIAYTEQPGCKNKKDSPFGEHSAETLFSLFTANIIEANIQFIR